MRRNKKPKVEVASDAFEEIKSDQSRSMTKLVPSNRDAIAANLPEEVVSTWNTLSRGGTLSKLLYAQLCQLSIPDEEVALFATGELCNHR